MNITRVYRIIFLAAVLCCQAGCESTDSLYQQPIPGRMNRKYVALNIECLEVSRADRHNLEKLLYYVDTRATNEQTKNLLKANSLIIAPVPDEGKEPAQYRESKLEVMDRRKKPYYLETGKDAEIIIGRRSPEDALFYFSSREGGPTVIMEPRDQLNFVITVIGETQNVCTVVFQPKLVTSKRSKTAPRMFKSLTTRIRMWRGRTIYIAPADARPNTLGACFMSEVDDTKTITLIKISL